MTLLIVISGSFAIKIITSLITKEKTELNFVENEKDNQEEDDADEFELNLFYVINEFLELNSLFDIFNKNTYTYNQLFRSIHNHNVLIEPPEK